MQDEEGRTERIFSYEKEHSYIYSEMEWIMNVDPGKKKKSTLKLLE